VRTQVLETFKTGTTDPGLSVVEVYHRLSDRGIQLSDVKKAAEFLALEGHLYATLDEDHYKSTS
jgi:hypothetical protein